MGLLDIFREANDDAHGARLAQHLDDTLLRLAQLSDHVRAAALTGFLEKRRKLMANIPNMSEEGVLKMGRLLQGEARKAFDLNMAEGYALWLTGAWAESMQRRSSRARAVHQQLDALATELERAD